MCLFHPRGWPRHDFERPTQNMFGWPHLDRIRNGNDRRLRCVCESKVLLTTYERGEEHPFGISPPYRPCYTEQYKNTPLVPPLLLGLLIIKRGNVFPLLFFPAKCQIERTRTSFSPPPAFITSPPCSSLLPPCMHTRVPGMRSSKRAKQVSRQAFSFLSPPVMIPYQAVVPCCMVVCCAMNGLFSLSFSLGLIPGAWEAVCKHWWSNPNTNSMRP